MHLGNEKWAYLLKFDRLIPRVDGRKSIENGFYGNCKRGDGLTGSRWGLIADFFGNCDEHFVSLKQTILHQLMVYRGQST
jgi:hypothetical protein